MPRLRTASTAVGTFVTSGGSSSSSPTFVSWNVVFSGGTLAHDFTDSSSTSPQGAILAQIPGGTPEPVGTVEELGFANEPGFDPYVDFYLGTYLTNGGGPMTILGAQSCDGTCYGLNTRDSNSVVILPEPSAVLFPSTILGLVGFRSLASP